MAIQDVRYFLNGMLLETQDNTLRAVSTDGHRMAIAGMKLEGQYPSSQVILPRKGVMELVRLLDKPEGRSTATIGALTRFNLLMRWIPSGLTEPLNPVPKSASTMQS